MATSRAMVRLVLDDDFTKIMGQARLNILKMIRPPVHPLDMVDRDANLDDGPQLWPGDGA